MSVQTYNHLGTSIIFNSDSAKFYAKIDGKNTTAPSLEAMKKKIDKAKQNSFEPFPALQHRIFGSYYSYGSRGDKNAKIPKIETLSVTGVKTERSRYNEQHKFVCEHTGKPKGAYGNQFETGSVTPDTPEARAAILNYYEVAVKAEHEKARLNEEIEKALEKIPRLNAEDFLSQKKGKTQ